MIRVWTVILIAVGLLPAGMNAFAYDLTNTSGRVFANVKVMDSWPNGLKVSKRPANPIFRNLSASGILPA